MIHHVINFFRVMVLSTLIVFQSCTHLDLASSRPPSVDTHLTVITDVDVFDGESMLREQDVWIRGDVIDTVVAAESIPIDAQATVVKGDGATLLPGLVDAHTHLTSAGGPPWQMALPDPKAYLSAFLYAGVTTIVVAQHGKTELDLAEEVNGRKVLGPSMIMAGPGITAPEGHPIPLYKEILPWPLDGIMARQIPTAESADQVREAIRQVHEKWKTPLLKIFFDALPPNTPQISSDVLAAAIDEAKNLGMKPVAHVGRSVDMVTAAEAGISLLMHCAYADRLNEEQVARIKKTGVPFVPTVRVWIGANDLIQGNLSTLERSMIDPKMREAAQNRPESANKGWLPEFEKQMPSFHENANYNTRQLVAAGVLFFSGTDTGVTGIFPGAALHREMAKLVELGIPAIEVLKSATSQPMRWLDPSGKTGRVAAGQRADLLLVRGDPTADFAALDDIEEVFLRGLRLERAAAPGAPSSQP